MLPLERVCCLLVLNLVSSTLFVLAETKNSLLLIRGGFSSISEKCLCCKHTGSIDIVHVLVEIYRSVIVSMSLPDMALSSVGTERTGIRNNCLKAAAPPTQL